ncbi:hypothetical protein Dda_6657 [Drechslerella dactyloides]|uniref:Apple domain-containing protein n=1 Tax=Drechslerella dactyloides TaxID=74499 RepID=A0AAD6NHL7_DREDA|nr:hypothetical protein Dda_6657 [Drechslerella dactyloides]
MTTFKNLKNAAALAGTVFTLMAQAVPAPVAIDGSVSRLVKRGVPDGYIIAFRDQDKTIPGNNGGWLGVCQALATYDVQACADLCNGNAACTTFNIYQETHAGPASSYQCCLFKDVATQYSVASAQDTGASLGWTISQSSAYVKYDPTTASMPIEYSLSFAIKGSPDDPTYIGKVQKDFTDENTPASECKKACLEKTAYNGRNIPASATSYNICNCVNWFKVLDLTNAGAFKYWRCTFWTTDHSADTIGNPGTDKKTQNTESTLYCMNPLRGDAAGKQQIAL